MHIAKNVFENISNTVINIKGKLKDNIKSRMYIALFYDHQNMELPNDGVCMTKPKVIFALEKKKHNFLSMNGLGDYDFMMDS